MCSHPDHNVVRGADGFVVAETHVLTDAEMERIQLVVERPALRMTTAAYTHGWPKDGRYPLATIGGAT